MATTVSPPLAATTEHKSETMLLLIAGFKLFKGVMLVAVAIGALRMLHRDVSDFVLRWVDHLRVDPDNRFIHKIIVRSFGIEAKQLKEISAGTFFYSTILLTEGIGLLKRKHWAEWFTVISTAVFIPLEVYEIFHRFTWIRVAVLVVNLAIVWYLVDRIRRRKAEGKEHTGH
jgi:uncharacterized membrane protein (DUF2068 family)